MKISNTAVMVTREGMGSGDRELPLKLMKTWLTLAGQMEELPGALCFYTEGVKLCVEGSPVLEELRALERRGVHLVLCKTCLDHYSLADKVAVGTVGGMGDILAVQWTAEKLIAL